jgi:hypothetical protein
MYGEINARLPTNTLLLRELRWRVFAYNGNNSIAPSFVEGRKGDNSKRRVSELANNFVANSSQKVTAGHG